MARINQLRAQGADCGSQGKYAPAPALTWEPLLAKAAFNHSQDMALKNFFSHTGSNGSTLGSRVDAVGYVWSNLGENIAAGQPSVDIAVDDWIASDGHCANMMNPALTQVGLACVSGPSASIYSTYWTMDLGRSR
jgi:uncharacterized protein YkwD